MTKIALVTGAATGLGRATAHAFAKAGMRVVVTDIARAAGEETAHAITAAGGEAIFVPGDVSQGEDVDAIVRTTVAHFGSLDCAFNNAGIAPRGAPITEMSEESWDRTIGVNLKGVWLCLKHECEQMLRQGGGAIVNTASIMGVVSGPGLSAYSASKTGVVGLTRSVALDFAAKGIRVNAVCPGGIGGTAITDASENRQDMDQMRTLTPMGRLGVPREIADTVVWLCSDQASFITGQALTVDGGFTIW
ncbi:glucose 1-dehydrogenase [Sphingomonas sp. C3-2]|uniref:glucose 1-dehydrogenase n=1 Tax=Sphingomonas sp. C3-2 TaxID=3062169 RepID=UPI00294B3E56|nr:glucose 1-dehydrogenase [Sphingomonas sp. C3-2]WOK36359.1 glucose 1-dehydrogenase [Sphingomonas sp. C3-2]